MKEQHVQTFSNSKKISQEAGKLNQSNKNNNRSQSQGGCDSQDNDGSC
ncbi:hypothetical protein [Paenibacillus cremeus]|nr:hypothetical protein [Paenibacillus cremeus]